MKDNFEKMIEEIGVENCKEYFKTLGFDDFDDILKILKEEKEPKFENKEDELNYKVKVINGMWTIFDVQLKNKLENCKNESTIDQIKIIEYIGAFLMGIRDVNVDLLEFKSKNKLV